MAHRGAPKELLDRPWGLVAAGVLLALIVAGLVVAVLILGR